MCFVFFKTYSWHWQKTLSTAEINFKQSGWYHYHLHTLGLLYSLSLTETRHWLSRDTSLSCECKFCWRQLNAWSFSRCIKTVFTPPFAFFGPGITVKTTQFSLFVLNHNDTWNVYIQAWIWLHFTVNLKLYSQPVLNVAIFNQRKK